MSDVYRAMIAVKKRLSKSGLSKARHAPQAAGGFAFRGIDDLYNALCDVEADENLLVFPRVIAERVEYQTNAKGNVQTHVHLTMELKFVSAVDGSSDIATAIGEGIDTSDKASGKAQSNAMKQAHLEVYKIPTEGLSDDVEAHDERVGPRTSRYDGPREANVTRGSDLVSQLAASIDWAEWERTNAAVLRSARTIGELQERWSRTYEEGQRSPNGTLKRLAVVKDECKSVFQRSSAQP